jgi:hypothetical protein
LSLVWCGEPNISAYPSQSRAVDPSDCHRCKVCGELALSEAVGSTRFEASVCDSDSCLESRVIELVGVELSKSYYAETLERISRVVVPKQGDQIDVRKLQASLIACAVAALHAINAPQSDILAQRKYIESRRMEDAEAIEESFRLA